MYQKILAPIDGSPRSLEALKEALQLAESWNGKTRVCVIHVTPPITVDEVSLGLNLDTLRREQGQAILGQADQLLASHGVPHDTEVLDGDPAQIICQKARDEKFDLIVLGNRGHGLFVELLLGSVSAKVVQHAPCPVLIVRR